MKKTSLFLACCIGLLLFASCKKDPIAPTITLIQGEGYLTENAHVYAEEEVLIGYVATGEKLKMVETSITQNGEFINSYPITFDEQPTFTNSLHIRIGVTGTVTITCTVTDATEQTASVSINVLCEEKPNAKFVGRYEGTALANGTMQAIVSGIDPVDQDFTDYEIPLVLELEAGETPNDVTGTCTIEDRTVDCHGTVEGNVVTFEAIDDTMTFDYNFNGLTISPQLNVTYNIKGTLTDGQLMLSGTCTGDGEIHLYFPININGTVNMDATVEGSLTKN
jgi:hypothetical protein